MADNPFDSSHTATPVTCGNTGLGIAEGGEKASERTFSESLVEFGCFNGAGFTFRMAARDAKPRVSDGHGGGRLASRHHTSEMLLIDGGYGILLMSQRIQ